MAHSSISSKPNMYYGGSNFQNSYGYSNNSSNSNYTNNLKKSPVRLANKSPIKSKTDEYNFGAELDYDLNPVSSSNTNNQYSNGLDFGPTSETRLKNPTQNSNKRRSARRFLEENNDIFSGSSNVNNNSPPKGPQFQFGNNDFRGIGGNDDFGSFNYNKPSSNSSNTNNFGGEFVSRRGGKSTFMDDNMMVGDNNYGFNKKRSENSNSVLFGMESRRGHK